MLAKAFKRTAFRGVAGGLYLTGLMPLSDRAFWGWGTFQPKWPPSLGRVCFLGVCYNTLGRLHCWILSLFVLVFLEPLESGEICEAYIYIYNFWPKFFDLVLIFHFCDFYISLLAGFMAGILPMFMEDWMPVGNHKKQCMVKPWVLKFVL